MTITRRLFAILLLAACGDSTGPSSDIAKFNGVWRLESDDGQMLPYTIRALPTDTIWHVVGELRVTANKDTAVVSYRDSTFQRRKVGDVWQENDYTSSRTTGFGTATGNRMHYEPKIGAGSMIPSSFELRGDGSLARIGALGHDSGERWVRQ